MSGLCSANTIKVSGLNAHSSSLTQCETFAEKGLKMLYLIHLYGIYQEKLDKHLLIQL